MPHNFRLILIVSLCRESVAIKREAKTMVSGVITQPYTLTIVTIVGIRQTSIRRITIALIRITTVDAIIKSTDAPWTAIDSSQPAVAEL